MYPDERPVQSAGTKGQVGTSANDRLNELRRLSNRRRQISIRKQRDVSQGRKQTSADRKAFPTIGFVANHPSAYRAGICERFFSNRGSVIARAIINDNQFGR